MHYIISFFDFLFDLHPVIGITAILISAFGLFNIVRVIYGILVDLLIEGIHNIAENIIPALKLVSKAVFAPLTFIHSKISVQNNQTEDLIKSIVTGCYVAIVILLIMGNILINVLHTISDSKNRDTYKAARVSGQQRETFYSNKDSDFIEYEESQYANEASLKDAQQIDNVVGYSYIEGYEREDGTEVDGHYRTYPDGIEENNFGYNGDREEEYKYEEHF